jgi:ABC-type polysaccharide/polyol phosphate transport system ATPase subunit
MIEIKNLTIEYPLNNNKRFKALSDISLKINDYDHVALVGRNGSGKSTLLRSLAGVYHPSCGTIKLSGLPLTIFNISLGLERDESGFNNVIIRGLYYGLTEHEVRKGVNKIKSFADLGDFLYQPVRVYSAGMRARLAFSILTIINREIYLVDEVIGVGDKFFKDKAKDLIKAKAKNCKNFILASHADQLTKEFCNKGLWLEKGKIKMYDSIEKVLSAYNK